MRKFDAAGSQKSGSRSQRHAQGTSAPFVIKKLVQMASALRPNSELPRCCHEG